MKYILTLFSLCCFLYCAAQAISYKKEVYESTSGIKIPAGATVLESYDTGDFFTIVAFKVKASTLKKFIAGHKFIKRTAIKFPPLFFGAKVLKYAKPDMQYAAFSFVIEGQNENKNWLYIADTKRNLLWAQIQYSDREVK